MQTDLLIQLVLAGMTGVTFAAAFWLGLRHARRAPGPVREEALVGAATSRGDGLAADAGMAHALPQEASLGAPARGAVVAGTLLTAGILAWRAIAHRNAALPVTDPFDLFLSMGLMLALTVIYFRWTKHLRSLSLFLLPMVVGIVLLGVFLGATHGAAEGSAGGAGDADYRNVWTAIHLVTIITATLCFALACVGGAVYLLADRQLRRKGLDHRHRWVGLPPLASIEKFNQWLIYGGFPLLSIATVVGILRMTESLPAAASGPGHHAKILFGVLSWLVYAVLLHVPLNPSFRGRRAAWLSILGFVLFLVAFVLAEARWS